MGEQQYYNKMKNTKNNTLSTKFQNQISKSYIERYNLELYT